MIRWAPPLVAVTSWLLVAASFGLLLVSTQAGVEDNFFHYQDAAVGIAFPMLGWLLLRKAGSHPIGWIMLVAGLSGAVGACAEEYVTVGFDAHPGALPIVGVVAWVGSWTWAFFFTLLPVLLLIFPDGRLPSSRWRRAAPVVVAPVVLLPGVLAAATWSAPIESLAGTDQPDFPAALEVLFGASVLLVAAAIVLALISLLVRWRESHAVVRQQLKVFSFAAVVGVVSITWPTRPLASTRLINHS